MRLRLRSLARLALLARFEMTFRYWQVRFFFGWYRIVCMCLWYRLVLSLYPLTLALGVSEGLLVWAERYCDKIQRRDRDRRVWLEVGDAEIGARVEKTNASLRARGEDEA